MMLAFVSQTRCHPAEHAVLRAGLQHPCGRAAGRAKPSATATTAPGELVASPVSHSCPDFGVVWMLVSKPLRCSSACCGNAGVPRRARARQGSPAAVTGAAVSPACVWGARRSAGPWSASVLKHTKEIEAAGLARDFLNVPVTVGAAQLFQGPRNPPREQDKPEGFDLSLSTVTSAGLQDVRRAGLCSGGSLTSSVRSSALLTQGRDSPYSLLFSTLPSGKRQLDSTGAA